jgi:hypothetical protein
LLLVSVTLPFRACWLLDVTTGLSIKNCTFCPQCVYEFCIYLKTKSNIRPICYTKVKWSRYRPDVAQRVGRGIALLFHDNGTRRGWVVSSTPRPLFTPGARQGTHFTGCWVETGPVWTGGNFRTHRDSIPNRPARSQSLYRLSYPALSRYID